MPRRRTLTDAQVRALPRKAKRYNHADPELLGMYCRVPPVASSAPISYAAVARDPRGRQHWVTIGSAATMPIDQARDLARQAIQQVKLGSPSNEPSKPTLRYVAEQWVERVVRKGGYRTGGELERRARVLIAHFGDRLLSDIRRSEIAAYLDQVEDTSGPHAAEAGLKVLRSIMRWWESRDDDFRPLQMRGMSRINSKGRDRILTDEEIRRLWATPGQYGDIVRLLLLTAQRRDKVTSMRWDDLIGDVWTIRTEAREKGNGIALKLPPPAMRIIERQTRYHSNPFIFAGRFDGPTTIATTGRFKDDFDIASRTSGWRIHDLRRTARSLMSRAGIRPDIAEKVLGHSVGGVLAIYDHHTYDTEKAEALEKLAALIGRIVDNPGDR
jgi:integrase